MKESLGMLEIGERKKYLGLPMCLRRSKREIFDLLRQRVWSRANGWKEKLISQARREILMKSVLQAILSYATRVFKLPVTFCEDIRSIMSRF